MKLPTIPEVQASISRNRWSRIASKARALAERELAKFRAPTPAPAPSSTPVWGDPWASANDPNVDAHRAKKVVT